MRPSDITKQKEAASKAQGVLQQDLGYLQSDATKRLSEGIRFADWRNFILVVAGWRYGENEDFEDFKRIHFITFVSLVKYCNIKLLRSIQAHGHIPRGLWNTTWKSCSWGDVIEAIHEKDPSLGGKALQDAYETFKKCEGKWVLPGSKECHICAQPIETGSTKLVEEPICYGCGQPRPAKSSIPNPQAPRPTNPYNGDSESDPPGLRQPRLPQEQMSSQAGNPFQKPPNEPENEPHAADTSYPPQPVARSQPSNATSTQYQKPTGQAQMHTASLMPGPQQHRPTNRPGATTHPPYGGRADNTHPMPNATISRQGTQSSHTTYNLKSTDPSNSPATGPTGPYGGRTDNSPSMPNAAISTPTRTAPSIQDVMIQGHQSMPGPQPTFPTTSRKRPHSPPQTSRSQPTPLGSSRDLATRLPPPGAGEYTPTDQQPLTSRLIPRPHQTSGEHALTGPHTQATSRPSTQQASDPTPTPQHSSQPPYGGGSNDSPKRRRLVGPANPSAIAVLHAQPTGQQPGKGHSGDSRSTHPSGMASAAARRLMPVLQPHQPTNPGAAIFLPDLQSTDPTGPYLGDETGNSLMAPVDRPSSTEFQTPSAYPSTANDPFGFPHTATNSSMSSPQTYQPPSGAPPTPRRASPPELRDIVSPQHANPTISCGHKLGRVMPVCSIEDFAKAVPLLGQETVFTGTLQCFLCKEKDVLWKFVLEKDSHADAVTKKIQKDGRVKTIGVKNGVVVVLGRMADWKTEIQSLVNLLLSQQDPK